MVITTRTNSCVEKWLGTLGKAKTLGSYELPPPSWLITSDFEQVSSLFFSFFSLLFSVSISSL